tara:strand:- start:6410 stop:7243 length:834 start_codon:yes stop_codon:yes gene_type:complete
LADHQQGWQQKFAQEGIKLPVWAGMTLHDVRRCLIQNLGVMQRCTLEAEAKNPIIVALDGKSWEEILPTLDQLRTTGCILKVNDFAFANGFDNVLPDLSVYGRVMLDLKLHDIKNTIANTCKRIRVHKPWAVTVHASGSKAMMEEAVKTLEGTSTKVLAVTVLTSFDEATCEEVYVRKPWDQVMALARIAKEAGAHGLVCSPEEVKELKRIYPEMTFVVPGVRSPGAAKGDQKRVATPREARDDGADHLVMGRQVLGAEDPVKEVERVMTEELGIAA